jgi:RNA polymerase sigma-70 factor (ECF subfamily)
VLDAGEIQAFRAGDPGGVQAVYREYGRLVFAISLRLLRNRGLAEDATQQTFVQAWKAAGSFDPGRELGPWLATIARRAAIDVHRRESRRAHRSLDDTPGDDPAMTTLPPEAEQVYDAWAVRRAVDGLPADEQEVVRLQHFDGLTHVEIAQRLQLPVGTVKSRSFRAHKRLAAGLGHLREVVR